MCKVYEKDKTEEDEDRGSDEGNVISPEHEETVGNKEGDRDKKDPQENLRTPPSAQRVSAIRIKGKWKRTRSGWRPFCLEYLERR